MLPLVRSTMRAARPLPPPPAARLIRAKSTTADAQRLSAPISQIAASTRASAAATPLQTRMTTKGFSQPLRTRSFPLAAPLLSSSSSLLSHRSFSTSRHVGFQSSTAPRVDLWPGGKSAAKSAEADGTYKDIAASGSVSPAAEMSQAGSGQGASPLVDASSSAASSVDPISTASEILASPLSVTATELTLSWWPNVRIMENLLLYVSEHTGAPWWAIIVGSTLAVRVAILPLVIKGQANAARLANIQEETKAIMEDVTYHKQHQDMRSAQTSMLQIHGLWKEHNCHPLKSFILPATQMPLFVSFFFALKALAEQGLDTLKSGGLGWATDLTAPDPLYIGPVLTAATSLATLETGAEFGNQGAADPGTARNIKIGLRAVTCVMPFLVYHLPAAVFYYWITNNLFSLSQMLILKVPAVRAYYNIPARKTLPAATNLTGNLLGAGSAQSVHGKLGRPMTFAESVRAGFDSQNELDEVKRRNGQLPAASASTSPESGGSAAIEGQPDHARNRAYEKWIKAGNADAATATNATTPSGSSRPLFEEAPAPAPAPAPASPSTTAAAAAAATGPEKTQSTTTLAASFPTSQQGIGTSATQGQGQGQGQGQAVSGDLLHREMEAAEKRRRVVQARERRQSRRRI